MENFPIIFIFQWKIFRYWICRKFWGETQKLFGCSEKMRVPAQRDSTMPSPPSLLSSTSATSLHEKWCHLLRPVSFVSSSIFIVFIRYSIEIQVYLHEIIRIFHDIRRRNRHFTDEQLIFRMHRVIFSTYALIFIHPFQLIFYIAFLFG